MLLLSRSLRNLERSYDKVNRFEVWNILYKSGIADWLLLVREIYHGTKACVTVNRMLYEYSILRQE